MFRTFLVVSSTIGFSSTIFFLQGMSQEQLIVELVVPS